MNTSRLYVAFTRLRIEAIKIKVTIILGLLFPTLGFGQIRNIIVDSHGDVGQYTSIALDSHGWSHISYYDATQEVLKYARIDNSGRLIDVVDNSHKVGRYCAITVDRNDIPHICYYDATNKDLKYAVKVRSRWTVQTIDSIGDVGLYNSITVDQFNNPYISYYDQGNGYLKLAYMEDGSWQIKRCCQVELNSGISGTGRSTVVLLEHMSSNPLILFFDFASKTLKLGIFDRTLAQWSVENVKDANYIFQDLSMSLDAGNQPHIAFSEVSSSGNESIQYGKKTCLGSGCLTQVTAAQPTGEGSWTFGQVDVADGNSVSLTLDNSQNLPWISFYDPAYGLRLSQKIGIGWSTQTIDPGWEVGLYSSIALDHNNYPHISYYDQTKGALKYASVILPRPIDVWIKDCVADDGTVPSISNCTKEITSPDIWCENTGGGTLDKPVPGVINILKARIRNRGFFTANNVIVKFYFSDFKSYNNALSQSLPVSIDNVSTLIGERRVTVAPDLTVTVSLRWTPPSGILKQPYCIGIVLDHPADRPSWRLAPPSKDNNFAVHFYK